MTILIGYEWRQAVKVTGTPPAFPAGVALAGQVRVTSAHGRLVATLTTANGGIVREADDEVTLVIPESATEDLHEGAVVVDIVRTDLDPPAHFGFQLRVPVRMPSSRRGEIA